MDKHNARTGDNSHAHQNATASIPLWRTFLYSLANAASLLTYWTFNNYFNYFYTDVKGLPPRWVGRGWFAFGFWNAVNDPIAGWLSDRTSTRWGRRRFYIGVLAIPTSIAFALIWLPPFDSSQPTSLLVYFLVIISIYDMLQSIVTLNQDALFPEMYESTEDRASGSSIRQLVGSIVGLGIAVALTPAVYGTLGWAWLAVLWGTASAVMYLVSLIGIQEEPAFSEQEQPSWREQIRIVFTNRSFLIVVCLNFVIRFILAVIGAVMPFFAKYVLEIEEEQLARLLVAFFATSGVSVLFWQVAVRRFGTRLAVLTSMIMGGLCAIPLLFTSSLNGTSLVLALMGTALGGLVLGPDMLFAEVVDEDFVDTGQRREGMYRGILGFVFRFPPALAGLMLNEGLALTGYDADLSVAEQPDAVITLIRAFAAILPLIGLALGILLMILYPLHGEYLRSVQKKSSKLRQDVAGKKKMLTPTDDTSVIPS